MATGARGSRRGRTDNGGGSTMRGRSESNPARVAWTIVASLTAFIALFAAGCGGGDDNSGGTEQTSVGQGEGKLSLLAWVGYVEDGSTDPKVDWVTPFEKKTGCETSVKVFN